MRRRTRAVATLVLLGAATAAGSLPRTAMAACATPKDRSLLLLSARSGAIIRDFAGVQGIGSVVTDGRGGWFATGGFTCVGNQRRARLVRLDHRGRVDTTWRPALPGGHPPVGLLARSGSTLYASGSFGLVALDAATGARRWVRRVAGGIEPGILALAANARAVYLGGGFLTVDAESHPGLAALDARSGKPLEWNEPALRSSLSSPVVNALALSGHRLYVGGNSIVGVDGERRPSLAAVDAETGQLSPWKPATAPGLNPGYGVGDVETILVAHGSVFSAGHDGFGIVSARTGAIQKWMREVHGSGYRFASFGSTVYLGGNIRNGFTGIGRQQRNNLAAIDLVHGRVLPWAPRLWRYVAVGTMAADADEVLVGGDFFESFS